jgi:putative ABC transport system substrate-binding protein
MRPLGLRVLVIVIALCPAFASAEKIQRLGILSPGSSEAIRRVTIPELARKGFVEGRNLIIDEKLQVPASELDQGARELLALKPDAVIAVSAPAVKALMANTRSVPLVAAFADDAVADGLVDSLSRPNGNVTGQSLGASELSAKRIELLRETVPAWSRFAVLASRTPSNARQISSVRQMADRLGVELIIAFATDPSEYREAFATIVSKRAQALIVLSEPRFAGDATILAELALEARLPAICEWDFMAREGCFLSFGPVNDDLRRRTAVFAAKILRGVATSELPIEFPEKFELVLNVRTARALGIEVPTSLLLRADEVIE